MSGHSSSFNHLRFSLVSIILAFSLSLGGFFFPSPVYSTSTASSLPETPLDPLSASQHDLSVIGEESGLSHGIFQGDITTALARAVRLILRYLGILLFIYIFYAGFIWMTAGGNAEKVDEAKKIILHAIIGMIVIVISYNIADFIIKSLNQVTASQMPI